MALFLEYDKTNRKVKRIVSAEEPPVSVAHIGYQEIPEGVDVDLKMTMEEIMEIISNILSKDRPRSIEIPPEENPQTPFLEL